jgi:DNA-binding CsgD family transcriptional regulator
VSITRRRGRPRFSRRDHDWLAATAPLAREAVRRMIAVQSPGGNDRAALHDSLRRAYRQFGASCLTEREREVVQLLLRGNSAKAIARVLAISPETARNHLKRIYPKLGVASQAELFALFFRALEQVEPGFAGDPLTRLR